MRILCHQAVHPPNRETSALKQQAIADLCNCEHNQDVLPVHVPTSLVTPNEILVCPVGKVVAPMAAQVVVNCAALTSLKNNNVELTEPHNPAGIVMDRATQQTLR